jgi:hypothetical protein
VLQQPLPQGVEKYVGKSVLSTEGEKLGAVNRFIPNRVTEVPEWIVVESGLFATRRFIVPLAGSSFEDDKVHIAYPAKTVNDQPEVESDEQLTPEAEAVLESYYGLGAA